MFILFSLFSDFGFLILVSAFANAPAWIPEIRRTNRAFVCANEEANKASTAFAVSDVASS